MRMASDYKIKIRVFPRKRLVSAKTAAGDEYQQICFVFCELIKLLITSLSGKTIRL